MELDDDFKRLINELGHAINDSLSESDEISDVMGRIKAAGYDLFLILEVTVGFNKKGEANLVHRQTIEPEEHHELRWDLTNLDAQFLRALKIAVDEDEEPHS